MKSDYSYKIPSLPYNKGERRRPKYFDGIEQRLLAPEHQHYPLLEININFKNQRVAIRNGGNIIVSVTNNGNGTAYTPFVELIETTIRGLFDNPPDPDLSPRRSFLMLPVLYPHQTRIVQLPWTRQFDSGIMVGICYDPILDPHPKLPYIPWTQPSFHRKITAEIFQISPFPNDDIFGWEWEVLVPWWTNITWRFREKPYN